MRFVLCALGLSAAFSTAALACDDPNCHEKGCKLPSSSTASTSDAMPADGTHVTLAVTGMHCADCADKVTTALKGVDGVKGASVDATTGKAEVAYDAAKTNNDKLLAAVAATGHFTATVAK